LQETHPVKLTFDSRLKLFVFQLIQFSKHDRQVLSNQSGYTQMVTIIQERAEAIAESFTLGGPMHSLS
jgi:hypothetical protein